MRKNAVRLAALGLSFALAGCAVPPPAAPVATVPEELPAGTGVVAWKVVAPRPGDQINFKWRSLTVADKASGKTYTLVDRAADNVSYSTFISALPAGNYQVRSFGVVAGGASVPAELGPVVMAMSYALASDSSAPVTPTFTVEVGSATNLGVLVTHAPDTKAEASDSFVVLDDVARGALLADMDPGSAAKFSAMPSRGWDVAPDPARTARAFREELMRPARITAVDWSSDHVLLGSSLGRVIQRSSDGAWVPSWTGEYSAITSVLKLSDGRIAAGTDDGRLLVWMPDSQRWVRHLVAPEERIVNLTMSPGRPGLLVETLTLRRLKAPISRARLKFLSEPLGATAAATLLDFESLGFWANSAQLQMLADTPDVVAIYNRPGFSRIADRYRIDAMAMALTATDELDHFAMQLYRVPDGSLARRRANGMSLYHDISLDNGLTWTLGPAMDMLVESFTTAQSGIGMALDGFTKVVLNETSDGGKTWARTGAPVPVNVLAHPLRLRRLGDQVLYYSGNRLWSTRDKGATWSSEWREDPRSDSPRP